MPSNKKEDSPSKARTGCRRGQSKQRHKFTREELKRLKQEFELAPYPNFSTKDELAQHFRCDVEVIVNWFQNKRARSPPELKDKFVDMRRMIKCPGYVLTSHQDTQVQASNHNPGQISYTQVPPHGPDLYFVQTGETSGEQYGLCDSVVQSIGTRSSGSVEYQGATGSGSSFNFRPTDFTLPPGSEKYYIGDQPKTQESQYSTFSLADYATCLQGQRQMDCSYNPPMLSWEGQQQNDWGYQQQLQQPQSYQERSSLADRLGVYQSHRDLGQQVPSFFPSEHQDQFDPSNGDCKQQSVLHQMPLWLHGQQGTADSSSGEQSCQNTPSVLGPAYNSQAAGI
ncbi:cytoplasmic polyadenylated homeobox-like protein 2 [Arvicanthis niloticus]|uniref:cytoplasmic polyadenylated homeobox-like protein 2 n=1 Tax=Arvicanthis niloticus TaxID=61156 RepID=UPI00402B9DA7